MHKYIFKGHDCFSGEIQVRDEIKQYVDCRMVTPPEAAYRLLEKKMKGRSHSVEKLPVHLPNRPRCGSPTCPTIDHQV